MCGIGGVWHRDGRACDVAALERMSEAMRERGPDDHGEFVSAGVGLIHRRLSILDLSAAGRCPITNEDGTIQVVQNGEIYNFVELREELEACGHVFRSRCDSEVIVHGYEEWGDGVAQRLHGMFALAIYDGPRDRLLLARDRLGKKPLYLLRAAGGFCFASTLNALHAHAAGGLEVDPNALECFLSHGFIPHPHTIWKGAESLPPRTSRSSNARASCASSRTGSCPTPRRGRATCTRPKSGSRRCWTAACVRAWSRTCRSEASSAAASIHRS